MAHVYLALQRGLPGQKAALVVVKVLRPEAVEDEHVLSLFTDEARIAMRLDHPNIIRTRDVIAAPPDYLLAMDFHDGHSLLDIVNRAGRLPLDDYIYILTKVLAGLGYAHELEDENGQSLSVVHRDVSPANVLVSYTGEVKLLDFGIAKATGALAATRDGVVRGKLGYAAPEQCLGQPADPRSDIYAVGVMLWEAITGRRRASGETWQSVLQARLDDTEPALQEVCPDSPAELRAIVDKAVMRDPNDRYATAQQFQTDLERYLESRGSATAPARIAAMLKSHFARDRAELHEAIKAYLNSRRKKAEQRRRVPVTGGGEQPPPVTVETSQAEPPIRQEETTAPIPVDAALLMLSRRESETSPDSIPTIPPANVTTAAQPPDPLPMTAPPPPDTIVPSSSLEVDPFGVVVTPNVGSAPAWTANTDGAAPAKRKIRAWPFVALAIGAAAIGAVMVVPRLESKKSTAAVSEPKTLTEPRRLPTKPSTAPKIDVVQLRISVDPADAVLRLDGRELSSNPFVATVPKDNVEHELTAVADACTDHRQTIRFNGDRSLLVAMKCKRQPGRIFARPNKRRTDTPTPDVPKVPGSRE